MYSFSNELLSAVGERYDATETALTDVVGEVVKYSILKVDHLSTYGIRSNKNHIVDEGSFTGDTQYYYAWLLIGLAFIMHERARERNAVLAQGLGFDSAWHCDFVQVLLITF